MSHRFLPANRTSAATPAMRSSIVGLIDEEAGTATPDAFVVVQSPVVGLHVVVVGARTFVARPNEPESKLFIQLVEEAPELLGEEEAPDDCEAGGTTP